MMLRNAASFLGLCIAVAAFGVVAPAVAQAPASTSGDWVVPRTPDGRPDLQGNWSSATITPLQRPEGQDLVLSWDEVEAPGGRTARIGSGIPVAPLYAPEPRVSARAHGHSPDA